MLRSSLIFNSAVIVASVLLCHHTQPTAGEGWEAIKTGFDALMAAEVPLVGILVVKLLTLMKVAALVSLFGGRSTSRHYHRYRRSLDEQGQNDLLLQTERSLATEIGHALTLDHAGCTKAMICHLKSTQRMTANTMEAGNSDFEDSLMAAVEGDDESAAAVAILHLMYPGDATTTTTAVDGAADARDTPLHIAAHIGRAFGAAACASTYASCPYDGSFLLSQLLFDPQIQRRD